MSAPLRYGSVCSGIEAATVAWKPLGWQAKFFSEIEKFPSEVLAHHYGSNMPGEPLSKNGIPNYGDFTGIGCDGKSIPDIDLLVGGTPCQSFSVAEKRLGPDGAGIRDDGASYTLEARQVPQAVAFDTIADQWAVRRLIPRECERLQGFDDDYTAIPRKGKPAEECADAPRYKALGNSMAVNVMRWIGERIQMVESLDCERSEPEPKATAQHAPAANGGARQCEGKRS